MCEICVRYNIPSCDCPERTSCLASGTCPIKLDFSCILYHKSNNEVTALTNLGLTNGATLELFAETVDDKLSQLNVLDWSLECLRDDYTINNLQQFGESVDTQLCVLKTSVDAAVAASQTALTVTDSATINFTNSGTLGHVLTGVVIISPTAHNLLSVDSGLFAAPQTLSVDYTTKVITISDGNSVSLASLMCTPSGWLGNKTADPSSPADGEYWFRSDLSAASGLKIRLNGSTRTITTS